jgi:hypothetical protein
VVNAPRTMKHAVVPARRFNAPTARTRMQRGITNALEDNKNTSV